MRLQDFEELSRSTQWDVRVQAGSVLEIPDAAHRATSRSTDSSELHVLGGYWPASLGRDLLGISRKKVHCVRCRSRRGKPSHNRTMLGVSEPAEAPQYK